MLTIVSQKKLNLDLMPIPNEVLQHLSGYVALNCVKTVCGCGIVGLGLARLHKAHCRRRRLRQSREISDDDDDDDDDNGDDGSGLERDYVMGSMIIGFGLFLAIPSFLSEGFLEAATPIVTASDVVSDVASNNLLSYVRSWRPYSTDLWKEVTTTVGGGNKGDNNNNTTTTTTVTRLIPARDQAGKPGKT